LNYLFNRYFNRLLIWTRFRMKEDLLSQYQAEDVLQEVFMVAMKKYHSVEWESGEDFCRWLVSIVNFKLRDLRKHLLAGKRNLNKEVSFDQGAPSPRSPRARQWKNDDSSSTGFQPIDKSQNTPSAILELKNRHQEFEEILKKLPSLQREAILLVRVGGKSVSQAAQELGEHTEKISRALVRGFINIRKIIRLHKSQVPYLAEEDPDHGRRNSAPTL
jgi:RNA polymerase sigma factor (sigma-70 family)